MKPAKNPWWQWAKTPKQGFITGGVWLFLAVGWALVAVGDPEPRHWVFAALWAVVGAGYLVPAMVLWRRQRSTGVRPGR
ncbi:hypothetical protein AB0J20_30625 [Micromonospora costi]|uniref:hypothetical protein n=1 Tax=Micromonospora costi TaxID=1530042 RepID=UPI003408CA0A